jgi:hypothetical protein
VANDRVVIERIEVFIMAKTTIDSFAKEQISKMDEKTGLSYVAAGSIFILAAFKS